MHSFTLLAGMLVVLHTPPNEVGTSFPFAESFDSVVPPSLPQSWTSSQNRVAGTNDFTSATSSPLSAPNALLTTNATITQHLVSPGFDFRDTLPDSITFFTRRSSSHIAPLVLEASLDGGLTFPVVIGDTLLNPGISEYIRSAFSLPDTLASSAMVHFRWRVIAGTSGSTGTLRIDDVSITVKTAQDLSTVGLSVSPPIPGPTDAVTVVVRIANAGVRSVSDFTASLFLDGDGDSIATSGEEVGSMSVRDPFEPGDSLDLDFVLTPLRSGTYTLIATVLAAGDGNPGNDTLVAVLSVRHPDRTLVINEIMFDPPAGVGEYLELFNPGAVSIDLGGWIIRDRPGSDGTANEFDLSGIEVPPGGFVVLAEDSTVMQFYSLLTQPLTVIELTGGSPSLNNDGDEIVILDQAGGVVDSVPYLPAWHHPEVIESKGRSLEKVSPLLNSSDARNWSSSADPEGGTPGRQNSHYAPLPPDAASLTFSPNPFSPDGDGHDDATIITFETRPGSSTFSLRIYDVTGRLIRQLATNELTGAHGSVVWDGLDDQRRKARIGMYVVYVEILSLNGGLRDARKGVVVLAGRL